MCAADPTATSHSEVEDLASQSLSRPAESDALPELPPLDEDDDRDDHPPEDLEDLGSLVVDDTTDADDDEHAAVDESDPTGIDPGISLDASELGSDDESGELVLDIRDLLSIADETDDPAADEPGFGAQDPDPAAEIDSTDQDVWLDSGDSAVDEPMDDLVSDELPELDDGEPTADDSTGSDEDLELPDDEPLPPPGPHPWSKTACVAAGEALSAVTVGDGQLVAAAVDILWFRENSEDATRLAARGSRIIDLVLAGPECDTAVFATGMGTLGRRRRASHAAEALDSWRAVAGLEPSEPVSLSLAVRPSPARSEIWLRAADRLLVSRDMGKNWTRTDIPGPVRTFALHADRIFAVVGQPRARQLVSAPLDTAKWTVHSVNVDTARVLAGDEPVLTAGTGVVALCDGERGVACSADGESFSRIPGCLGVTAATTGALDGRPTLWLAVLDAPSESTLLVVVDVETQAATTIAELAPDVESSEDGMDEPRVTVLTWDGDARRLWGLTRSGLYRWQPPH